jgi:hypothetical protein
MENRGTGNEPLFMLILLIIWFSIMGTVALDTGARARRSRSVRRDLTKKF